MPLVKALCNIQVLAIDHIADSHANLQHMATSHVLSSRVKQCGVPQQTPAPKTPTKVYASHTPTKLCATLLLVMYSHNTENIKIE